VFVLSEDRSSTFMLSELFVNACHAWVGHRIPTS
jgi:hypothetical protein